MAGNTHFYSADTDLDSTGHTGSGGDSGKHPKWKIGAALAGAVGLTVLRAIPTDTGRPIYSGYPPVDRVTSTSAAPNGPSAPNAPATPIPPAVTGNWGSYYGDNLRRLPGTGGVVESGGTPPTTREVVVVPPLVIPEFHKIAGWSDPPAVSTVDKIEVDKIPHEIRTLEMGGLVVKLLISVGRSSDFTTDPKSYRRPEPITPTTGWGQQDWSVIRSVDGKKAASDAVDNTQYENLPIKRSIDQNVLNDYQYKKFSKNAKSLGYQDPHELTVAVLTGQDTRQKAYDTVEEYALKYMGKDIYAVGLRTIPAVTKDIVEPGIPPKEAPFFAENPAVIPKIEGAPVNLDVAKGEVKRKHHMRGGKTQQGYKTATERIVQPRPHNYTRQKGKNPTKRQRQPLHRTGRR